jgi:hypothetical protein
LANGNGKRIEPGKNKKIKNLAKRKRRKTWLNKNWIMETW